MTRPMPSRNPGSEITRKVDAKTLWSGGVATAVVAGLIALVGILVCRWLFNIPILSPRQDGAWGDASTAGYVVASAAVALAATGLMHLLLLAAPYPRVFFGWIIGLATVIAVVYPFSTTAPMSQKLATAVVNLILGVAIGTLVAEVSRRAGRRVVRYQSPAYPPSRTPGDPYS
jgi:Family of unknown function (DUF6069)